MTKTRKRGETVRRLSLSRVYWLSITVALVIVALAARRRLVAPFAVDEAWARIQRDGVMRVGMDASYPPFELEEQGQFSGLDVDLARALADGWGVEVQFANIHFDGLYDALETHNVDLIISALPWDRMRTQDVLYSYAYLNAGQVLLALREDGQIDGIESLDGQTVAVELGAQAHQLARQLARDHGLDLEIAAEREPEDVLALVREGRAIALICDYVMAYEYMQSFPELTIVGEALSDEPFVIAARLDSPSLMAQVNAALLEWGGDGRLQEIKRLWLGPASG